MSFGRLGTLGAGFGLPGSNGGGTAPFVFTNAEAAAAVAAMTSPQTSARKTLIDNWFTAIKAASILTKLDSFQEYAAADSQAALVDWILPSRIATLVNAPSFVADRGFTGNGTDQSITTNYTAGSGSFLQDSSTIFAWSLTAGQDASLSIYGGINTASTLATTLIAPRNASNQALYRMNRTTTSTVAGVTDGSGLFWARRDTSTTSQLGRNTTQLAANTSVSSNSMPTGGMTALKVGTAFSARQVAVVGSAGYLNDTEIAALYNATLAYMQGVGAA